MERGAHGRRQPRARRHRRGDEGLVLGITTTSGRRTSPSTRTTTCSSPTSQTAACAWRRHATVGARGSCSRIRVAAGHPAGDRRLGGRARAWRDRDRLLRDGRPGRSLRAQGDELACLDDLQRERAGRASGVSLGPDVAGIRADDVCGDVRVLHDRADVPRVHRRSSSTARREIRGAFTRWTGSTCPSSCWRSSGYRSHSERGPSHSWHTSVLSRHRFRLTVRTRTAKRWHH